jgi:hypothetical protein
MPAVGVDQGPIAFRTWLRKYGAGGPPVANILDPTGKVLWNSITLLLCIV